MSKIAQGVFKQLRYSRQVDFDTVADGAVGGQQLRRVTSSLDLTTNAYRSNEIRPDMQRADFRHGTRSVSGSISGELSVGTYKDFFETFCRQAYQAAATSGPAALGFNADGMVRSAGSFVDDGFKVGDVVRATGYATAALNGRNFLVTNVGALQLTGFFLDETPNQVLAEAAGVTVTLAGKKTWIPEAGHVNHAYTFEHYFSDLDESEVFEGCRIAQLNLNLPATGFATIEIGVLGKDMKPYSTGSAPYFVAPAAVSTGTGLVAVNGALLVDGVKVATLTGITVQGNANASAAEVVGSNTAADIFVGAIDASGQITSYFESTALRDKFLDEAEASIVGVFVADNTPDAGFVSFVLPRVKFGGAAKDDGEKGLVLTLPYTALKHPGSAVVLPTTMSVQDSSVV